jgi:hypothetical protein
MENCFPASKDPESSPITLEELKKLVRIWKLNERRNFWKTHSERDEIVTALIQHAEQNLNYQAKKNILISKDTNNLASSSLKPAPPNEIKPSSVNSNAVKNFCGLRYFNRQVTSKELVISGRFFKFPDPKERVDAVVDIWRSEDFDMKDDLLTNLNQTNGSQLTGNSTQGGSINLNANSSIKNPTVTGIKNKVKIVKQRNLAMHLMNYSAHIDVKKTSFSMKTVQTFVTVAESDDPKTVSKCMIALSNISSEATVRNILLEMNTMHKITNMLQYLRGKAAHWAAALLFYYFSCDKESEDRVYNACSVFLQVNGSSKDSQIRLVTLYTLNNLMPCIDRQRIAELIMRILISQFEPHIIFQDKHLSQIYLTIMQNMTWFSNAHATLLSLNILEILEKFARYAVKQKNGEMGLSVAKTLQSFLQLPDQAANIVGVDFIVVLSILFETDNEPTLVQALKAAGVLSFVPALRKLVHTTELTRIISTMVIQRPTISNVLAKEISRYFCNITLANNPSSILNSFHHSPPNIPVSIDDKSHAIIMERLLDDNVHDAIFAVLKSQNVAVSAKSVAIRALQNIVSHPSNGFKLANQTIEPMIKFLRDQPDLGAAAVLYNLACIPLCRQELVESKIHIRVLEFMTIVREPPLKSAFLQILVQLSGSNVCIVDLLRIDLIHKLESQIKFVTGKNDVWRDISLMLLAVVAYTAHDLTEADQISIVHILRQICVPTVEQDIIENCANVLKFISTRYTRFVDLDPVVRSILELGDGDDVTDNISTILYNMTCNSDNLQPMLKDSHYVNVMIRIMRNGKVHVQENIAYAIRTLCSIDKCTELLLKYDIISDLIVIALLRTSSEEIKIVCSQAFYNMLCHKKTRLELLKGDLWWALMRLGRTDSQAVRSMCIRALLDLSYPLDAAYYTQAKLGEEESKLLQLHKSCIQAIRAHHCLSFVKDLSLASSSENLLHCLHVVHNLLKQFAQFSDSASGNPFAVHEVIASVRIAADALNRSTDIKCVRISTILLLKCAQLIFNSSSFSSNISNAGAIEANPANTSVDNEFINIDIIEILRLSIPNWKFHSECRLNISRLLFELSKRKFFVKLVPLNDLNVIFLHIYNIQNSKENSIELLENLVGIILQFVVSDSIKPKEVIQLSIWPLLLKDALSNCSSFQQMNNATLPVFKSNPVGVLNSPLLRQSGEQAPPFINTNISNSQTVSPSPSTRGRMSVYQRDGMVSALDSLDVLRGAIPSPFRIQGMTLILLSYCIDEMLLLLQKYYQKNDGKLQLSDPSHNFERSDDQADTQLLEVDHQDKSDQSLFDEQNTQNTIKKGKKNVVTDNTDDKAITESLLTINFPALLQGIIKTDFIDFVYTRNNLLHILHCITQYNTPVIEAVFFPDAFQLLVRLLNTSVGSARYEKTIEYCSCFLRNIAVNHNYLPAFIQLPHFQVVNELINELCDLAVNKMTIAMDLSIFFYFLSDYLQSPSGNTNEMKILSPKFSLDMINKLLSHQLMSNNNHSSPEELAQHQAYVAQYYEMININKYTISIILNKYTFLNGVEPQFIQNMYSYLQTNSLTVIPNLMKDVVFKRVSDSKSSLHIEYLQIKDMLSAELLLFYNDSPDYFSPIVITTFQDNDHIVLKLTNSKPVVFEKIENMEALSIIVFQKIMISFEPTTEQQYDLQNNMISEENDEDEDGSSQTKRQIQDHQQVAQVVPINTLLELANDLHEDQEEDDDDEEDEDESKLSRSEPQAPEKQVTDIVSSLPSLKLEKDDRVTSLPEFPTSVKNGEDEYSMNSFEDQ